MLEGLNQSDTHTTANFLFRVSKLKNYEPNIWSLILSVWQWSSKFEMERLTGQNRRNRFYFWRNINVQGITWFTWSVISNTNNIFSLVLDYKNCWPSRKSWFMTKKYLLTDLWVLKIRSLSTSTFKVSRLKLFVSQWVEGVSESDTLGVINIRQLGDLCL